MKKRIFSFLLALLMVVSLFPVQSFATDDASPDQTELCTDCGNEVCTCNDAEGATTEPGTEAVTETTTGASTDPACTTCGQYDCASQHTNWCDICKVDDCGKTHCPTCGVVDCTTDHTSPETPTEAPTDPACTTCGQYDCTSQHTNWCADCKADDCGVDHTGPQPCGTCGSTECDGTHENWCADCKVDNCGKAHVFCESCQRVDCGVDHTIMILSDANSDSTLSSVDYSGYVGRKAQFNTYWESMMITADPTSSDTLFVSLAEYAADYTMVIADWYWNAPTTELWYKVSAAEGWELTSDLSANPWILQNYTEGSSYPDTLILLEETPKDTCAICGQEDCTMLHFYCSICKAYDCSRTHLYCNLCETYDCEVAHTFCGTCGEFDCDIRHEDAYKPSTAPAIPENPTLNPNKDVSVVDENGNSTDSFYLVEGTRSSISAWSDLDGISNASYQWQVRYDNANDLWADIQGQTGKGLLASAAMFRSIAHSQGSTAVRCVITSGEETVISEAISVRIQEQTAATMLMLTPDQIPLADEPGAAIAAEGDDENKVNVIINYVFTDGRVAANPWAASLPAGAAYETTTPITVPTIAGYAPQIGEGGNASNATLDGYKLTLNFSAADLAQDCTVNIVYQPAAVKVVVNHHWQNVNDDNYTLHETEEKSLVTETTVGDAHKTYEGFYNLIYEHPTVAADGSTVVDVYYDRYYYLMTFELSGGYGVEPVYARYGVPVKVGTPTRAGYTFQGWSLNGEDANIPTTMPAANRAYAAKWGAEDTEYARAYWVEHEDGSKTYIGSEMVAAKAGSTVSGSDTLTVDTYVCGRSEHTHDASCEKSCTLPDHTHGDGTCQYICGKNFHDHTSGCDCTQSVHSATEHTRDCYVFTDDVSSDDEQFSENDLEFVRNANDFVIYSYTYYWGYVTDYYVQIGNSYYQIGDYSKDTSLEYTFNQKNCHYHTSACCKVEEHTHSADCCSLHAHDEKCYSCGKVAHSHSDDCKTDLAKYVQYKRADQEVTVDGDGSSIVNVYYEYNTYTIRFLYARQSGNGCYVATWTGNGNLGNSYQQGGPYWQSASNSNLPTFIDPSGKTERSVVTIGNYNYYYISLTAKYGADISSIWPSANIGQVGSYYWGSWAAAAGTGYREKYGDAHANIVGPYPTMSADMIVDDPQLLDDGTYLAQNMIAWWGGSSEYIEPHAYHNYFELLPGDERIEGQYVTHNGKDYKLVETYTFTAAHNGDTRVDPIFFNGFKCVNDTSIFEETEPEKDIQRNSVNFYNKGEKSLACSVCGNVMNTYPCNICDDDCDYCNTFYYDRNVHKIYFWNHNGYLQGGTGSEMPYGASLVEHGKYVTAGFMSKPENYPDGLEPGAYEFEGWYTTSDCLDGTEMDWNTTMPDSDFTVYAKWVPVKRTVRFFLDKSDMEAEKIIPDRMAEIYAQDHDNAVDDNSPYAKFATRDDVSNRSFLSDVTIPGVSEGYDSHPYKGYNFVGWFYMEGVEEKAFDPANMPVTQDLDLYGKWSSNVLCPYVIRYALDVNQDGQPDAGEDGNIIYVADPVTGSTLAGNSRTFDAKGDTALYANYQSGYYPNVASHTIDFKASDESGVEFTFLYTPSEPVPYTVKYLEKGTNEVLYASKTVNDNTRAVVTENFHPVSGYMPDAYQKTLVVVPGGENEIIFWYTKDVTHAFYQVNHYVQTLDGSSWMEYRSAAFTGEIGANYSADAISITGFTFSEELTKQYNTNDKKNMYTGASLPGDVIVNGQTVSGALTGNGMELNLYYTRDQFSYTVQYLEFGTSKVLHEPKSVTNVYYNTVVTEQAVTIQMDMDGDGKNEDFQLYEATNNPQTATIKDNSTVLTFYYVRCTAEYLTVTKEVKGNPGENLSFDFTLTSTATDFGGENVAYTYELDGVTHTTTAVNGAISFSLKDDQAIKFLNLPTAVYTVTEVDLPTGYYNGDGAVTRTLTADAQESIHVVNTFDPAKLVITKTVEVVEDDTNTPEVEKFEFVINVPTGVTGSFDYTVGDITSAANVSEGKMTVYLQNGETATFPNLPTGNYTVTEADYSAHGYDSNYKVNQAADYTEGRTAHVALSRGTTQTVGFMNKFPVGDLTIEKTVSKEFYGTAWTGDTFTFTVERTTENRPLITNNQYKVLVDDVEQIAEIVADADGKLTVTVTFNETDAEKLTASDSSVKHTLVIKNLPAGTYKVTEQEEADYVQTPEGLTVGSMAIPAESTTAFFTNTVKRKSGNLYLEKELIAATGYNPDALPQGTKFCFTISLQEQAPSEDKTVTVAYNSPNYTDGTSAATSVTMSGGGFEVMLEAGQNVTISGLPEGKYRITEATIPSYANSFAHKENGTWVEQGSLTTTDGRMYTEIDVGPEKNAEVKCTNTYPVNRAELVIQKLVTKEYDRDTLPGGSFIFTVTLDKEDTGISSYSYTVHHSDGSQADTGTATVANRAFTIELQAGQYAVIPNMPVCGYTVSENTDSQHYNASYKVYVSETGDSASTTVNTTGELNASGYGTLVSRTFSAGKTDAVVFTNEYKRHLGTLTINKTVTGTTEQDLFIFHIKGTDTSNSHIDMDVPITGTGSVTIYDLPLGSYTVTEDTDWSWRYTASASSQTANLKENPDAVVTFANTHANDKWLNYTANMPNVFSKKEDEQEGS